MKTNPIAYEWHNLKTGHSYVDYTPHVNQDVKDGYTKFPLYKEEEIMMVSIEQRTEELLSNNPHSIHPSRLEGWQFREAIRFLAKEIDVLHKLRIRKNSEAINSKK